MAARDMAANICSISKPLATRIRLLTVQGRIVVAGGVVLGSVGGTAKVASSAIISRTQANDFHYLIHHAHILGLSYYHAGLYTRGISEW